MFQYGHCRSPRAPASLEFNGWRVAVTVSTSQYGKIITEPLVGVGSVHFSQNQGIGGLRGLQGGLGGEGRRNSIQFPVVMINVPNVILIQWILVGG